MTHYFAASDAVMVRGPFSTAEEAWKHFELPLEAQARQRRVHYPGTYVWPVNDLMERGEMRPGVWYEYGPNTKLPVTENGEFLTKRRRDGKSIVLSYAFGVWFLNGEVDPGTTPEFIMIIPKLEVPA